MKWSGNRWIEALVSKRAKGMVEPIQGEIPFTPWTKPMKEAVIALITTAGVHLKTQQVFQVEQGDPSVRLIPGGSSQESLMISHTHYDRTDADQDINCVFPLERLQELAEDGVIGGAAPTHYGLMGYIPNTVPLLEQTIPYMLMQLKEESVDGVLLNPG
jgi:D-proline reductase (dithiol) PrdB